MKRRKKRSRVKLTRCEPSSLFLVPPLLELDVERTKELGATFAPVTSNNDTNATTFKVLGRKESNIAQAIRSKSVAWVAVSWKFDCRGSMT